MRRTIPSTIANAVTRAERAAGQQRIQICIAASYAASLPQCAELELEIAAERLRVQVDRRRDNGALVLSDMTAAGPGPQTLYSLLSEMGLGVGDHPEFEVQGDTIRLLTGKAPR